jgi:7-cyano-7-deazaguanine synthase
MSNGKSGAHALALLSGGIDSAVTAALALNNGFDVRTLHVSYGQAAAAAERRAAMGVAAALAVPLDVVEYNGLRRFGPGEIRGRNSFLIHVAALELAAPRGAIMLGIHAGTDFADCEPDFVEATRAVLARTTAGAVDLVAPLALLTKGEVARLARELAVDVAATHSCDAADVPCGDCQSCRDRAAVLAEADVRA